MGEDFKIGCVELWNALKTGWMGDPNGRTQSKQSTSGFSGVSAGFCAVIAPRAPTTPIAPDAPGAPRPACAMLVDRRGRPGTSAHASMMNPRAERLHEISSTANPRVKLLRALATSRGVRRHRRALVCGRRLVEELLARQPGRVESLIYPAGDRGLAAAVAGDRDAGFGTGLPGADRPAREILVLPHALFREIDPFGIEPPLAVVTVEPLEPWDAARETTGLTLFLPLGDPENVGAALRSAAAFEVARVVLLAEAAYPFHPRAIRAAAGACFDLTLRAGPSLDGLLVAPPAGIELLVLDRDGEPLDRVAPLDDRGLLVGEEGRGFAPRSTRDLRRVSIPIASSVDSLNGAVAVGIALWELRRKS
jgi:tRNA G18 (ribose-2'-O)-methylase SpoU